MSQSQTSQNIPTQEQIRARLKVLYKGLSILTTKKNPPILTDIYTEIDILYKNLNPRTRGDETLYALGRKTKTKKDSLTSFTLLSFSR